MSDHPTPDLGDMDVEAFRAAAHRVADEIADYLRDLESYPVLPAVKPGDVSATLPEAPPTDPQPMVDILDDYKSKIQPNITHWQHPKFMAYFPSVASGPGILGEMLAAGLNSNVMLWRNAPASTELEVRVIEWLRQMMGLPVEFRGMFTDTASISSLLALVAARHRVPGLNAAQHGLGHPGAPRLRMYQSSQAHSSIDKAAMVIGIGRDGVRHIDADANFRMDSEKLAAAIREDRAAGWTPFCVVATIGTTSSTSVDPVAEIAQICADENLWLHIDAAYAGAASILPEMQEHFHGWERADSIVFNLHKWFFTPFDASLLLFREPDAFRNAFSLVHEYLKTSVAGEVVNFNEYGIQLGRRFRALKVWMQIRHFGVRGLQDRLREHCRQAQEFRSWVEAEPDWDVVAPTPFSLLCVRYVPAGRSLEELDALNERILNGAFEQGGYFLSHTRLNDRYTIRIALGNPRQRPEHVIGCWDALRAAAARHTLSSQT